MLFGGWLCSGLGLLARAAPLLLPGLSLIVWRCSIFVMWIHNEMVGYVVPNKSLNVF